MRWLHRRGLAGIAGVTFTAREQAGPFYAAGVIPRTVPTFEIPESSSLFQPGDRACARAATGLHGDPCLLWLGNLDRNKDPLTVLAGVARSVPRLPDPQLWCAFRGRGLLAEVEARVAGAPALAGRVHLLGEQPRDQVELLLCAADFLLQGSHREGSGYVVLEALACGTTPIVTSIPPFRALTGGGRVGGLFPPGDVEALASALVEWAVKDRDVLRRDVRRHFDEHLSFDVLGQRLVDVYGLLARA